jgi:hypothetical protein
MKLHVNLRKLTKIDDLRVGRMAVLDLFSWDEIPVRRDGTAKISYGT